MILPGRLLALLLLAALCCRPQSSSFRRKSLPVADGEQIRGAALATAEPGAGPVLFTWGARLLSWTLPDGGARVLVDSEGPGFGAGGCLADVNRDGLDDIVLLEAPGPGAELGRMVWLEAPEWRRHEIDSGAEFQDCLPATIHGRRGVLLVHRYMQVRFYRIPEDPRARWPYREIYSIYTPSQQGGLLLADVDGDGRDDILCGNYWIRSPDRFELPWRLHAINLWSEAPLSAMTRLVPARISGNAFPDLIASQGEMPEARLAWFERPADPRSLWPEHRLEGRLNLRFPRALAAGDLDNDGKPDLVVGERNGPGSRLVLLHNQGGGKFRPSLIGETSGLLETWIVDLDGDGRPDILGAGPASVSWWRNHLLR